MQHIKQAMSNILINSSKAKFLRDNENKFVRYFKDSAHYRSLINAGNFKKIEEIVRKKQPSIVNNGLIGVSNER
jgi:hypothetical protein